MNFQSVLQNIANPAAIATNLGFQFGVKTGEVASTKVAQAASEVKNNLENSFDMAAKNISKGVSTFTVNAGMTALVVILFIALFMRAIK